MGRRRRRTSRSYIGNSVSSFSQSESRAIPQTIMPFRCGAVTGCGVVPMTLPLETCVPSPGVTCVWTVRATATVAIKAAAAAARNFVFRDIILSTSILVRNEITQFLLCTRHALLTLICPVMLISYWNIAPHLISLIRWLICALRMTCRKGDRATVQIFARLRGSMSTRYGVEAGCLNRLGHRHNNFPHVAKAA